MAESTIYYTKGTCSQAIILETEGDIIVSVQCVGGCSGNPQGIAALVRNMRIDDAIERLEGIDCAGRGTSCPDQLAKALRQAGKK